MYIGSTKIPPNVPYVIKDSDIIGLGWSMGAQLVDIQDSEKYVFKFVKEKCRTSITSQLRFQDENGLDEIESRIAELDSIVKKEKNTDIKETKMPLKRKIDNKYLKHVIKQEPNSNNDEIVNISDSDSEPRFIPLQDDAKKPKLEPEVQPKQMLGDTEIKIENDLLDFDSFNVKQEYLGYDEPIQLDSESDSESQQWLMRLSQSSPGKPFLKVPKNPKPESFQEVSYSQLDDFVCISDAENGDDEDFVDDLISLPIQHPDDDIQKVPNKSTVTTLQEKNQKSHEDDDSDEFFEDIISLKQPITEKDTRTDELDGYNIEELLKEADSLIKSPTNDSLKKAEFEEPVSLKKAQLMEPDLQKRAQLTEPDPLKKAQMIDPIALLPKTKLPSRAVMESKLL